MSDRVYSCAGSPIVEDYELIEEPGKAPRLNKIGEHNIQDEIDAYGRISNLDVLIARAMSGDITAIPSTDGMMYGDTVDAPHSLADAYEMIAMSRRSYDDLSDAQRDRYGSYADYVRLALDNPAEWFARYVEQAPQSTEVTSDG